MFFTVFLVGLMSFFDEDYLYTLVIPSLLLGQELNRRVCVSNGGTMPVFSKRLNIERLVSKSERHHIGSKDTKFMYLADVIDIKNLGVFSVGDVFCIGSVFVSYIYIVNRLAAIF
jgi:hypothetical protein